MNKSYPIILLICFIILPSLSCSDEKSYSGGQRIVFLHHSTGQNVWFGDVPQTEPLSDNYLVPRLINEHNEKTSSSISITEVAFPKGSPYPWENYPYDYYNIWVLNGDKSSYKKEPTLKTLTKDYDLIVFKHCFPVSNIVSDELIMESLQTKTLGNYKFIYGELKTKMYEYPETKFLVWTGAALVESATNSEEAARAQEFFRWVKEDWDEPNDNIYIFDFYGLETGGGLYLKPEYAASPGDSHPNIKLSTLAGTNFVKLLIDITEE